MGLSWFMLGYADSGQEKAQSLFKDILSSTSRRRKQTYHLQEEEGPYTALRRSRIPHTFQAFKGFGHHILESSDKKKKKQVVNKIWRQLRNLLAKVHDKNPPAEIQPLLHMHGAQGFCPFLAWLLRVWEVSLVWGSFSFTSCLNVPFLEVSPLSFIL